MRKYNELMEKFEKDKKFQIASGAYKKILAVELRENRPDYILLRRILRNATVYRIRSILPLVLENFETFAPIVREFCLYVQKVLSEKVVIDHKEQILKIVHSDLAKLPYVNMWISWLLSDGHFKTDGYDSVFDAVIGLRDQALIAIRAEDRTWVKTHKNGLDTLGPYEKRAILFASQVLSSDERRVWMGIAKTRGEFLEQVIADHMLSTK
jgi:hypothetical protein